MKILLDRDGTVRLQFCSEIVETGDRQLHFTAAAPARTIIVFHNGLDPARLSGAVMDAGTSFETGPAGFVRPTNVGVEHSKIAFYERVNGPPDDTLSRILADGLQD
jgi:hypothetical protein